MEELIEGFLRFLAREKKATENTITSYRTDLKQFSQFCSSHPQRPTLTRLDQKIIQDYLDELRSKGYAPLSIARKLACLRSFFNYWKDKGLIKKNPTEEIAIARKATKEPRVLTLEEMTKLCLQSASSLTPLGIRDLAMLELLLATGMKVTELVSLDVEAFNLDPRNPYVRIEHNLRAREIRLPAQVAQDLERYLEKARPKLAPRHPEEKALFLNRWGERLTRYGVWVIIQKYAWLAGFQDKISPITLRYAFAARQLGLGVSPRKLQELLGHVSIDTTHRLRNRVQ